MTTVSSIEVINYNNKQYNIVNICMLSYACDMVNDDVKYILKDIINKTIELIKKGEEINITYSVGMLTIKNNKMEWNRKENVETEYDDGNPLLSDRGNYVSMGNEM